MKALRLLALLFCLSGLAAIAQEYPEFTQWMKATDRSTAVLRKLEQKVGPQAVGAAETLGGVYENMIGFFRQQGGRNAVQWSEEGKSAAAMLASAAHSGDAAAADAAFKTLNGTCRGCHDAYRERTADGKYRFKQPGSAPPPAAQPKPAAR